MKRISSVIILCSMIFSIIITQTGCAENPVSKTSYYMDTVCEITIYDMEDMSERNAEAAIDAAFGLCAEYESLISATREESDIYRLNHADGKSVECDPRTVAVIEKGLQYGDISEGRFDITIGKVTNLWDFHAENPQVPSEEDTERALADVNYKNVSIEGNMVTLGSANMAINLGGLGKGYVADRTAELLEEKGVTNAVINFGGNIIALGDRNGEDFRIGIKKPFSENDILGYVTVKDATVVTSGIYERGFEKDGKYYHHILDVQTGYPVENDVVSVSLIGSLGTSGDCDAMSTICLLLGAADGAAFIESVEGVEALFVDQDGNITMTSGLDNFVEESN